MVAAQSACATTPAQPSAPIGLIHAERHTWGGLCASGPCASDLVVEEDGDWTYSSSESDDASGTLSDAELEALRDAVASTGIGTESATATGCAADSDGTSVRYAWTSDDGSGAASSCETVIDEADSLVRYLEELAASVG